MLLLARETAVPAEKTVRFTARVRNIDYFDNYSGKIIVVDGIESSFALTLEVLAVHSDSADFTRRQTVSFAIHSPTQVFGFIECGSKHVIGKIFDFSIDRTQKDGRTHYSSLLASYRK